MIHRRERREHERKKTKLVIREVSHDTFNAIDQSKRVEIHEQTKMESGEFEISLYLCFMYSLEPFNCLKFHDHGLLNEQIDPKTSVDFR